MESKTDYQPELGGMSGTGDDSYLDVDIKTVASTMFFEYPLGEVVELSDTLASRSQDGLRSHWHDAVNAIGQHCGGLPVVSVYSRTTWLMIFASS